MPDQVRVEGADTLARTLRSAVRAIGDLSQTNTKVAAGIGVAASQRAPRRTGRLAASGRPSGTATEAVLTFGVVHASPIQWGVGPRRGLRGPHNISPTRFATEAAADTQPVWLDTYTERVQSVLDQVRGA